MAAAAHTHAPTTSGRLRPRGAWGVRLISVKTCDLCGKRGGEAETMTWVTSVENGRRKTYCDTCSREHLRAIESKLDSEWW